VIGNVVAAFIGKVPARAASPLLHLHQFPLTGQTGDKPSSTAFYPRIQRPLRHGDTLVVETGTCMTHLNRMLLKDGKFNRLCEHYPPLTDVVVKAWLYAVTGFFLTGLSPATGVVRTPF
jgi:hypothetical protein